MLNVQDGRLDAPPPLFPSSRSESRSLVAHPRSHRLDRVVKLNIEIAGQSTIAIRAPRFLLAGVDNKHISAYSCAVRRKPGQLVPLEIAICVCAAKLRRSGTIEFHGYEIAKRLGDDKSRRLLTAYGTLYRALGRLEAMGLLQSQWEDPRIPARESRPGRRLYTLTAAGEAAAQEARQTPKRAARRPVPA
jgi:PadR family transcriptional regulator, regulatory protein PadR